MYILYICETKTFITVIKAFIMVEIFDWVSGE